MDDQIPNKADEQSGAVQVPWYRAMDFSAPPIPELAIGLAFAVALLAARAWLTPPDEAQAKAVAATRDAGEPSAFVPDLPGCTITSPDGRDLRPRAMQASESDPVRIPKGSLISGACFQKDGQ